MVARVTYFPPWHLQRSVTLVSQFLVHAIDEIAIVYITISVAYPLFIFSAVHLQISCYWWWRCRFSVYVWSVFAGVLSWFQLGWSMASKVKLPISLVHKGTRFLLVRMLPMHIPEIEIIVQKNLRVGSGKDMVRSWQQNAFCLVGTLWWLTSDWLPSQKASQQCRAFLFCFYYYAGWTCEQITVD